MKDKKESRKSKRSSNPILTESYHDLPPIEEMFLYELKPLLGISALTGNEGKMISYLKDRLEDLHLHCTIASSKHKYPSKHLYCVRGENPRIGLCAHADTVAYLSTPKNPPEITSLIHKNPPDFYKSANGQAKNSSRLHQMHNLQEDLRFPEKGRYLWKPNSHLGLDCKAGLAIILTILQLTEMPIAILITVGEEQGYLRKGYQNDDFKEDFLQYIRERVLWIVLDRHGRQDMVVKYKGLPTIPKPLVEPIAKLFQMKIQKSPNFADAYALRKIGSYAINLSLGGYGEHNIEDFAVLPYVMEVIKKIISVLTSENREKILNLFSAFTNQIIRKKANMDWI
ncbi:MAG: hypothetical protein ACOC35_10250 [Promethearchaeia archaeon]